MIKKYIYVHICCKNNWYQIFENIINFIKVSKLYDVITEIRCCVLGNFDKSKYTLFDDEKITIINKHMNMKLYERFTLNNLYDDCQKEDFYVLYLHTKGITKQHLRSVKDWVDYMLYFNTYKHKEIFNLLEKYNAIGVNFFYTNNIPPHFSGNFWWSKSSYIKTLKREIGKKYCDPEFWLCSNNIENFYSLNNSNINHYKQQYPREKYVN